MIKKLENLYRKHLNSQCIDLNKKGVDENVNNRYTLISSEVYKPTTDPVTNEKLFQNIFTGRIVYSWELNNLGATVAWEFDPLWKRIVGAFGQLSEEVRLRGFFEKGGIEEIGLLYRAGDRYHKMNTRFYKKTWWLLKK